MKRKKKKKKAACKAKLSDNQRRLLSIAISDGIGLAHKLGHLPDPPEHLPGVPFRRGGTLSHETDNANLAELKFELENARRLLAHRVWCCNKCHTIERAFVAQVDVENAPSHRCETELCGGVVALMPLEDALVLWGLAIHQPRPRR